MKNRDRYVEQAIGRSGRHRKERDDRLFPFSPSMARYTWKVALSKSSNGERDSSTNRYKLHPHVPRKFFRTRMGAIISVDVTEALMVHQGYLTEVYRWYSQEDLAKFYRQGEWALLVFTETEEVGKLHAAGGGRIISIDNEPDTFHNVQQRLGKLAGLVEFIEADLTNMPQVADASVDIIVCHATICAVNDRPLNAVNALSEFHRTLTDGGLLIIVDEYPLPTASKPEETVQVQRWQLYKAVAELVDGRHYTEIYPKELIAAAHLVGFKRIETRRVLPEHGRAIEEAEHHEHVHAEQRDVPE